MVLMTCCKVYWELVTSELSRYGAAAILGSSSILPRKMVSKDLGNVEIHPIFCPFHAISCVVLVQNFGQGCMSFLFLAASDVLALPLTK